MKIELWVPKVVAVTCESSVCKMRKLGKEPTIYPTQDILFRGSADGGKRTDGINDVGTELGDTPREPFLEEAALCDQVPHPRSKSGTLGRVMAGYVSVTAGGSPRARGEEPLCLR